MTSLFGWLGSRSPTRGSSAPDPDPPRIVWQPHGLAAKHVPPPALWVDHAVLGILRSDLAASSRLFGFLLGELPERLPGGGPSGPTIIDDVWQVCRGLDFSENVGSFRQWWEAASEEAERRGRSLVGWYHCHGLLGAALSPNDGDIHRKYFDHDGQCALILVPEVPRPMGGFIRLDPGFRYIHDRLVSFSEILDPGDVHQGYPLPTWVNWGNYQPDQEVEQREFAGSAAAPGDPVPSATSAAMETAPGGTRGVAAGRRPMPERAARPERLSGAQPDAPMAKGEAERLDRTASAATESSSEPADSGAKEGKEGVAAEDRDDSSPGASPRLPVAGGAARATPSVPGRGLPARRREWAAAVARVAAEVPIGNGDLWWVWQVLWDRRRTVLGVLGFVLSAVAIGTFLESPVYRATGLLEIHRQGQAEGAVGTVLQIGKIPNEYLQTQYGILRSRELARRVVTDLGLVPAVAGAPVPAAVAGSRAPIVARFSPGTGAASSSALEQGITRFQHHLAIEPVSDSWLVRVSYEDSDPTRASRAVNAVFRHFADLRVDAARSGVGRLTAQLDTARNRLVKAEDRLQEYMRSNNLLLLQGDVGPSENLQESRLRQLQNQLMTAQADLYAKQASYSRVARSGGGFVDNSILQTLSVRAADLRAEYERLRTTFKPDYPRVLELKRQLDALETQLRLQRQRAADEVRDEYLASRQRVDLLEEALRKEVDQADKLAERTTGFRILKNDVEGHRQLYALLQKRSQEARAAAGLMATEVSVVDAAVPPDRPVRPLPARNLFLGLLAGLVLGGAAAFAQEYLNPAVRTMDDVDALTDAPVLGVIPSVRKPEVSSPAQLEAGVPVPLRENAGRHGVSDDAGWYRIDRPERRRSALADAFGELRTSVFLNGAKSPPASILITSARQGEGKTTVAINLALSLARLDRRVLLVDADLRNPSVHRSFEVAAAAGLAPFLARGTDWRVGLQHDVVPNLDILPAGTSEENAAELLSRPHMRQLIRDAEGEYEFVIVDAPALLITIADARILGELVQGVVVVVRRRVTPRQLAKRALRQASNLIGVVLNDFDLPRYGVYLPTGSDASESNGGDPDDGTSGSTATAQDKALASV